MSKAALATSLGDRGVGQTGKGQGYLSQSREEQEPVPEEER